MCSERKKWQNQELPYWQERYVAPDIQNVSTITTIGCVKFSLTGVKLLLQTYGVLLYLIFWSYCYTLFV